MSINKSIYEALVLESNNQQRTVDITQGAISIDYYEDIFSPTITAKIKVLNSNNSITPEGAPENEKQSIYNGLPLRGGERLLMKISGNSPTNPGLDFSRKSSDYFYVSSITDIIAQPETESFTLHLISREAITNETSRVSKKFPTSTTIDSSIRTILTEYLKTDKIGTIDKTSNSYGFIGNLRKPFTVLVWLSSKAVPGESGGQAGFFFYQTQDGFQFRSIDSLINQEKKATYSYAQAVESYDDDGNRKNNDFTILNYKTTKNENLIEKLRLGAFASQRMFFDPLKFTFTSPEQGSFKQSEYKDKTKTLGRQIDLPKLSQESDISLGDVPSRIFTQVLDVGTLDSDVSKEINYSPMEYQSQSLMRYNSLFTQVLDVTIPSNTNLRAGDVIECDFPKQSNSKTKESDPEISGLYIIKELCHHFDAESSYTSLKLIRDTFGQKSK
jgi:flagellar hook protein FlgE